jgi:hypothetical protein
MTRRQKFKTLVHYVCSQRADSPATLGAVKLNKILWLSDLKAFYKLGQSITGARYIKRQFGPVPAAILPVLAELENEGVLTIRNVEHFGKQKKEYIVHQYASDDFLLPEELKIVKKTINIVCDEHTATSISYASHDHIWKAAEDGEEIPHFTVFAQPGSITAADREWARMQLESVTA